jgi:spore germination cell wall hydrolase CwlJ-like protein
MGAALAGSGMGLSLGAAFLVCGMAEHAADYARARHLTEAADRAYAAYAPPVLAPAPQPTHRRAAVARATAPTPTGDLDCMADAVYYEARGEGIRGQRAVAQVVMNRVKQPGFPKSVCGVVFQRARHGCQFSFACDGSMRHAREAEAWRRARRVAARALAGVVFSEVGSATHFHAMGVTPAWGDQMRRVAQVGEHVFYRFAPRKPQAPAQVVLTAGAAPQKPLEMAGPALVEKVSQTLGGSPAALTPALAKPAPASPPLLKAAVQTKPVQPALAQPALAQPKPLQVKAVQAKPLQPEPKPAEAQLTAPSPAAADS